MTGDSRRHFLGTVGLTALAGGLPVTAAKAFSIEPLEGAVEESYLAAACGRETGHRGFIAEVQALLAQYGSSGDPATVEQVVAATRCPYCRCPLTAAELAEKNGF